jgi:hypothetical protein
MGSKHLLDEDPAPMLSSGPWMLNENVYPLRILSADGYVICDGIMPSGLANARLMRAAPDLVVELRNMVEMFAGTDEGPGQHEAVASARRLLAALALDA